MRIVEDVAGGRLRLEGDGLTLPREALPIVAIAPLPLFAIPLYILWRELHSSSPDGEIVLFMLGWLGVLIAMFTRMAREISGFAALFDIDREAGVARLGRRRFFGGELDQNVFGLDRIRRVSVRRLAPAENDKSALSVEFQLGPSPRSPSAPHSEVATFAMMVERLTEPKDVVAFALRLGAAAGLPHSRVLRNDPRVVEVELASDAGVAERAEAAAPAAQPPPPSASPSPAPDLVRADASSEAIAAAATAAAAEEKVAPFDPRSFEGDRDLRVWMPGREVVFHESFGLFGWLAVAASFFVFAGPLAYAWLGWSTSQMALMVAERSDRLMISALIGAIGLMFGGAGLSSIVPSLPSTVRIDWVDRVLSITAHRKALSIPLDAITAVVLECVHDAQKSGGTRTGSIVIHRYRCQVRVVWRGPNGNDEATTLAETFESDEPDAPYRMTLPLATELAEALGVERRVKDYGGGTAAATLPPSLQ